MALTVKRLAWEGTRWLSPAVFVTVTVLYAIAFFLETASATSFVEHYMLGALDQSVFFYTINADNMLSNAGLCLMAFLSVGDYARDYEEGAVYMRIQRMGVGRYAGMRIAQASVSAFLIGFFGMLLFYALFSAVFHLPLFPDDRTLLEAIMAPKMLLAGNEMECLIYIAVRSGLRTLFVGILTVAVSLAMPRHRLLVAAPLVLVYLTNSIPGIFYEMECNFPAWLDPGVVFRNYPPASPEILGIHFLSEWGLNAVIAGAMALLAAIIWLLFCLRLRGNGVFGGEQSE